MTDEVTVTITQEEAYKVLDTYANVKLRATAYRVFGPGARVGLVSLDRDEDGTLHYKMVLLPDENEVKH